MKWCSALLLAGILTSAGLAQVVTDLANLDGTLKYSTLSPFQDKLHHPAHQGRVMILADLDGDGHNEAAFFTGRGVVAEEMGSNRLGALWQVNVPVDLAWTLTEGHGRFPRYGDLGLAADINNDGQEELFLTIADPDRTRWHLFVIDPATEAVMLTVELPLGPDRRQNDHWDGVWEATGILPPGQASPHACLVLTSWVQYDAKPRGFTALDLVSGEIIWRFAMGGNPSNRQTWIGDLEGDGAWEIVAPASGPGNLGGETISGMSDDQSWLVVVAADGTLRRCSPQGGLTSGFLMHVADLDGDGVKEIATASVNVAQGKKESLRIFTPELELISRVVIPGRATGLSAGAHTDGASSIFLTTDGGIIGSYRFHGDRIDPPREAASQGAPILCQHGDLLPEPGHELLIVTNHQQQIFILNEDLQPLFMTEPLSMSLHEAQIWSPEPDTHLLLTGDEDIFLTSLVKNPVVFPIWWVIGPITAVLILIAILVWHRRRQTAPRPITRDILARLLFDLEQSNHGAVAVTHRLRQLQTLLGSLRADRQNSPRLRPHTRRTFVDFTENDLLTVHEILDRADAAHFEPGTVKDTRQALERAVSALDQLTGDDLPAAVIDQRFPALKLDIEAIELGLQSLRRQLEDLFSCDLVKVLDRVCWAREYELERHNVTVHRSEPDDDNWSVLVDPKDLRFVLDNLVGNAITAMQDAPRRNLTIALRREPGSVVCMVSDTGLGITEEVRQRLFHTRFSTHAGGGLGLFRSRQLLGHWGGQVELEKTVPGKGSTFVVQLATTGPRLRVLDSTENAAS